MKKEYGSAAMKLIGVKTSRIFEVADGIITAAFDKNMNPDKSLDEIIAPLVIDYLVSNIGRSISM
ncbi:hypothetical protein [Campylobacter sp. CCUG 57310]|uniref:hypothetical protein n=1 Tax=Campylobacter sp. CCUG 57310 TaxID=2517362 RepID=UPI0015667408|nr:hypothetical protein [Campylobacter sp. CCUG 57310]QKF92736.1 hypothetical protein CORI_1565 [Campylobacter sp. CCUG 57310]